MGMFESKTSLYRLSREVKLSVLTQSIELRIVKKQFKNGLKYLGYKYIHQGMYIVGIKGMTRKKLGTKVLITLLDKRWDTINKAALGFLEGDMNENSLITYIAPDLIIPIKEFIEKMSFGFQTKGYEDFNGTNLLISIKFMSPLRVSSEERAGEEWSIGDLIEKKALKQPEDYISYENNEGKTSIRFIKYKSRALDDIDSVISEQEVVNGRRHSVLEFMEKLDVDTEINYYEEKLKQVSMEYNNTMTSEWPLLRDKELYFYRELSRLKKLKKDKELAIGCSEI